MNDPIEWYSNNSAPSRWYGLLTILNSKIIFFVDKTDIFFPKIWGSYDNHKEFADGNILQAKISINDVVATYTERGFSDPLLNDSNYVCGKIIKTILEAYHSTIIGNIKKDDIVKFKKINEAIIKLYSTAYTDEFNS